MPPPSEDSSAAPPPAIVGIAVEVEGPPLAAPGGRRPGPATQSVGRGGIHHQPYRTVLGQIPRPSLLGRRPTRVAPRTEVVSACRRCRQQFTESTPTTSVYRTLSAAFPGVKEPPQCAGSAEVRTTFRRSRACRRSRRTGQRPRSVTGSGGCRPWCPYPRRCWHGPLTPTSRRSSVQYTAFQRTLA